MCSIYLFKFVLFEGLDSPIYPDDFQDVVVKDEPLEPDTVSCKHMQDIFVFQSCSLVIIFMDFYPMTHKIIDHCLKFT